MKFVKTKIVLFLIFIVCIIFFSNDFGIIDIKRAAIITAIAIDYEENEYSITTQIDVPEATDKNEEKAKTQITTKGETIASAIKHIGSSTGWFPQLYFCNLIIIGSDVSSENTIKILDYFAKTLRVQDSANVILSSTKGSDLLSISSPFDDISSFAIQKILLKSQGFDNDIDVAQWCNGSTTDSGSVCLGSSPGRAAIHYIKQSDDIQFVIIGALAQLARAPAWHAGGHRFDPDMLHQFSSSHFWGISSVG